MGGEQGTNIHSGILAKPVVMTIEPQLGGGFADIVQVFEKAPLGVHLAGRAERFEFVLGVDAMD